MNPGDGVLYPNPGYPIYESQIEYFGGVASRTATCRPPPASRIDLDQLRSQITPATKVLIYNNLQNPLGCESSLDEMRRRSPSSPSSTTCGCFSDEAYFEMRYSGTRTSIASLPGMRERTVILYTFSKKFAMTGWRLGAAVGPDEPIADRSPSSTPTTRAAPPTSCRRPGSRRLRGDQTGAVAILAELERRRDAAVDAAADDRRASCVANAGGDLLPVPQRHRRDGRAAASPRSPSSPTRRCTAPASRSAPGATSAGRSPARPSSTCASPTRASRSTTSPKGIGQLREWIEAA